MSALRSSLSLLGTVFAASVAWSETPLRIVIDSPTPGHRVRNEVHQAPIAGSALAATDLRPEFDVMIAIDVSGSTAEPCGIDLDGDGELGFNPSAELVDPSVYPPGTINTDPGDSILAAEIAAADALLRSLEADGRIRVGIVSFSGEMNPRTGLQVSPDRDARLEVPLTADFEAVRRRLPRILMRGPFGGTNFAAGLAVSVNELAGLPGARSQPRPGARRVVLFLTDGVPTFPDGHASETDPGDVEKALAAAHLAHKAGIVINTYGIGQNALANPIAASEIARITEGTFLPVRNPANIVSFLQGLSFANVDDVVFTNLSTREVSYDVDLAPDGTFSGFVPVREGRNRIRVTALGSDGGRGSTEIDLDFETAAGSERRLALELERVRERNKELMLLIERDRIQRFRETQRKELELEAGEPESQARP